MNKNKYIIIIITNYKTTFVSFKQIIIYQTIVYFEFFNILFLFMNNRENINN